MKRLTARIRGGAGFLWYHYTARERAHALCLVAQCTLNGCSMLTHISGCRARFACMYLFLMHFRFFATLLQRCLPFLCNVCFFFTGSYHNFVYIFVNFRSSFLHSNCSTSSSKGGLFNVVGGYLSSTVAAALAAAAAAAKKLEKEVQISAILIYSSLFKMLFLKVMGSALVA